MENHRYVCVKCGAGFTALHFKVVRLVTGRTVEHCGTPARWIGPVRIFWTGRGDPFPRRVMAEIAEGFNDPCRRARD